MKLVQKILSHGLLIAFLVAAFFIYMNRAEILPQWFGDKARTAKATDTAGQGKQAVAQKPADTPAPAETVAATEPQAAAPVEAPEPPQAPAAQPVIEAPVEQPAVAAADVNAVPVEASAGDSVPAAPQYRPLDEPEIAAPTESSSVEAPAAVAEAPVVPAAPVVPPAVEEAVSETETPAAAPAVAASPDVTATTDKAAEGAATESASPAPASETVAAGDVNTLGMQLEEARQLFWQRDMQAAEAAYQALGKSYPDNPDVWGEIGNFYFTLRQREPAFEAYAQTMVLLNESGDGARAQQVLGVLFQLDAEKAQGLEQRLRQPGH